MKRMWMMAVAMAVTGSAMADFRPGYERPLMQADLVANQRTFPLPVHVMTTRQDGSNREITGITLTEDTGLRCVTTPCPSQRVSQFVVTGAQLLPGNSVAYTGYGNLVVKGPLGRPRIVQRSITLVDHSNSVVAFPRPYLWEVTVRQGLAIVGRAVGNPEVIYTTAGIGFSADNGSEE